jgi:hypothetical protein
MNGRGREGVAGPRPGAGGSTGSDEARPGISWRHLIAASLLGWWSVSLATSEMPVSLLDNVDYLLHQAGHLLFFFLSPCGVLFLMLGGTLVQLGIPAALVYYFAVRQRALFPAAICLWWLGQTLINISVWSEGLRTGPVEAGGLSLGWISVLSKLLGVLIMLAATAWAAYFALPGQYRERCRSVLFERLPALSSHFD